MLLVGSDGNMWTIEEKKGRKPYEKGDDVCLHKRYYLALKSHKERKT